MCGGFQHRRSSSSSLLSVCMFCCSCDLHVDFSTFSTRLEFDTTHTHIKVGYCINFTELCVQFMHLRISEARIMEIPRHIFIFHFLCSACVCVLIGLYDFRNLSGFNPRKSCIIFVHLFYCHNLAVLLKLYIFNLIYYIR